MTKKITTFFTNSGTPQTGLSATIRIWDLSNNTLIITDAAMTEVAGGFYSYNFTTYDELKSYAIRCDGSASITAAGERYTYAGNESYEEDLSRVITAGGVLVGQNGVTGRSLTHAEMEAIAKEVWKVILENNQSAQDVLLSRSDFKVATDKVLLAEKIEILPPNDYRAEFKAILGSFETVFAGINAIVEKPSANISVNIPDSLLSSISSVLEAVKNIEFEVVKDLSSSAEAFMAAGNELHEKIDSLADQMAETNLDLSKADVLADAFLTLKDSLTNLIMLADKMGGDPRTRQALKSTLLKLADLRFNSLESNLIRRK